MNEGGPTTSIIDIKKAIINTIVFLLLKSSNQTNFPSNDQFVHLVLRYLYTISL